MERIICYIDGYNFFHATKNKPSANINLQSLALSFLDTQHHRLGTKQLIKVYYFSALATWRKKDMAKHKDYIKQLTDAGVEVVLSHFKKKRLTCADCHTQYWRHEEKESDVRLALQILDDAIHHAYDTAFILSGDSDIVPAIEKVKSSFPEKRILIALPKHSLKHARDITKSAHGFINLSPSRIKKHMFI